MVIVNCSPLLADIVVICVLGITDNHADEGDDASMARLLPLGEGAAVQVDRKTVADSGVQRPWWVAARGEGEEQAVAAGDRWLGGLSALMQ